MKSHILSDCLAQQTIDVIDSHTAGEPTRVVISGGPPLSGISVSDLRTQFSEQFDGYRSAIINEPRGSDVLVGALLTTSAHPQAVAGVIFFNNIGMLGMCGHGMIGVIETLNYLGRISVGTHLIETPVGLVRAELEGSGEVTISNVVSYRTHHNIGIEVPGIGNVWGDIAWGGNWFFLTRQIDNPRWSGMAKELQLAEANELLYLTTQIRKAVNAQVHSQVDHVELFCDPVVPGSDSRNFVLCPGGMYDRSPCGTGTSAKLACLAADGLLNPGEEWVQESILGTQFRGRYEWAEQESFKIHPTITGRAYVTGRSSLILKEDDPFCWGIRG